MLPIVVALLLRARVGVAHGVVLLHAITLAVLLGAAFPHIRVALRAILVLGRLASCINGQARERLAMPSAPELALNRHEGMWVLIDCLPQPERQRPEIIFDRRRVIDEGRLRPHTQLACELHKLLLNPCLVIGVDEGPRIPERNAVAVPCRARFICPDHEAKRSRP